MLNIILIRSLENKNYASGKSLSLHICLLIKFRIVLCCISEFYLFGLADF